MKKIVCMKNGKCFDRFISGTLDNEQQEFAIADEVKELCGGMVAATVLTNVDIPWTGACDEKHYARLVAGQQIAVKPEFIETA